MGIFDWKHWIVLLVVVVLVFGTKKLKNFGSDLGESIKGFRKAMNEEESKPAEQTWEPSPGARRDAVSCDRSTSHSSPQTWRFTSTTSSYATATPRSR